MCLPEPVVDHPRSDTCKILSPWSRRGFDRLKSLSLWGLTLAKNSDPDPGRGLTPASFFDPDPGRGPRLNPGPRKTLLILLTELEHLKNLLKKTPYFKERRRESSKEKRRQKWWCPKIRFFRKLGRVQQITVKKDCRVQNWIAKKGTLQKKDHT